MILKHCKMTISFLLQSALYRQGCVSFPCCSLHSNSGLTGLQFRQDWHLQQLPYRSYKRPYSQLPSLALAAIVVASASPPPPPARRALGVDYGRKHIGLAVSTLGLAPRPMSNMRGGGLDMLMQMAQGVIDAALAEGKKHKYILHFQLS